MAVFPDNKTTYLNGIHHIFKGDLYYEIDSGKYRIYEYIQCLVILITALDLVQIVFYSGFGFVLLLSSASAYLVGFAYLMRYSKVTKKTIHANLSKSRSVLFYIGTASPIGLTSLYGLHLELWAIGLITLLAFAFLSLSAIYVMLFDKPSR